MMIFGAFDIDGTGQVSAEELTFLEDNVANRAAARDEMLGLEQSGVKRHEKILQSRGRQRRAARRQAFRDFLLHLERLFGNVLRGWRRCLDPTGSMVVKRTQFLKACKDIDFQGDRRFVWKELDKDDS